MREWVIKSYSGYKGLVLQGCEMEEAGPGEVRLRIEAFALNWGDADPVSYTHLTLPTNREV